MLGFVVVALAQEEVRLDQPVRPLSQLLELTVDPAAERIVGHTRIELQVDVSVPRVRLHAAKHVVLTKATLGGKAAVMRDGSQVTLVATKPPKVGTTTIDLEFEVPYDAGVHGLLRMTEGERTYVYTDLEPDHAREVFPCFDEPGFAIPWTVSITAPAGNAVLANAPVAERTEKKGLQTVTFATTPALPSYLVAFAVGPWVARDLPGSTPAAQVWAMPGHEGDAKAVQGVYAAQAARLAATFDEPVPNAPNHVVLVPHLYAGAMENPGLITVGPHMVRDPAVPMASTMAHELAHQWLGNRSTLKWWDDLWLNESLASWVAGAGLEGPDALSAARTLGYGLDADGAALRGPVEPGEIELSRWHYSRGARLVGTFAHAVGEDAFQKGLRRYVRDHRGPVDSAAFFASMAAEGIDVKGLEPWLDAEGTPLIVLTRDADGVVIEHADGPDLPLPVFRRGPSSSAGAVVAGEPVKVAVGGAWVLPLAGGVGFARFDFADPADLDALVAAAPELTAVEAVAVAANLRELFEAGRLAPDRWLAHLTTLSAAHPAVRSVAVESIEVLHDYAPDAADATIDAWALTWLPKLLEGLPDDVVGAGVRQRVTVAMARAGDPEAREELRAMGEKALEEGASGLPEVLRAEALRVYGEEKVSA
ncbi:MAG: hypothetical protein KC656_06690, partial [Myxococcales bacterium]|nr:hypothetical protein [Myxococcales bacterium]